MNTRTFAKFKPEPAGPGHTTEVIYTTGDVAKICGVAPRTVTKWADSGRLKSYRLPGSLDRRVTHAALEAFMLSHGMGTVDGAAPRRDRFVLLVGFPPSDAAGIVQSLEGWNCVLASNSFEAGAECVAAYPAVVVIDSAVGRIEAAVIAESARRYTKGPVRVVLATSGPATQTDVITYDAIVEPGGVAAAVARASAP